MDNVLGSSPGESMGGPEATEHVDPFLARRVESRPWELRAAQWRARTLAEIAFEGRVSVSLVGRPGYPSFRGLLYLSVPFSCLSDHNRRQSLFLDWAGQDSILKQVSLIFVFEPIPAFVS